MIFSYKLNNKSAVCFNENFIFDIFIFLDVIFLHNLPVVFASVGVVALC